MAISFSNEIRHILSAEGIYADSHDIDDRVGERSNLDQAVSTPHHSHYRAYVYILFHHSIFTFAVYVIFCPVGAFLFSNDTLIIFDVILPLGAIILPLEGELLTLTLSFILLPIVIVL